MPAAPTTSIPAFFLTMALKTSVVALMAAVLSFALMSTDQSPLSTLLHLGMSAGLWVEAGVLWALWWCVRVDDGFYLQTQIGWLDRLYVWLNRIMMPWCLLTGVALVTKAEVVPRLSVWLFGR